MKTHLPAIGETCDIGGCRCQILGNLGGVLGSGSGAAAAASAEAVARGMCRGLSAWRWMMECGIVAF